MTSEKILTLKKLKELWVILKDEEKSKVDKRSAMKDIIKLQGELVKSDPTFEAYDLTMSKYAEFLPVEYRSNSKVKWIEEVDPLQNIDQAVGMVKCFEYEAVQLARDRQPTEPVDSQKFGIIVGHYTKLVADTYFFLNR